ncbi:ribonuclease Y [Thermoflexus sp.]|uniref:ribonuclease Y n=1 Tax=Thermoflexus sp. TaxID=1969742 RepID=UPI0017591475|nr:ribonuclease Y [Thermoflexus sp.]
MDWLIIVPLAAIGVIGGGALGWFLGKRLVQQRVREQLRSEIEAARQESQRLIEEAKQQAAELLLQAKDEALRLREATESELRRWRADLRKEEERLRHRREELDRRAERLEKQERRLNERQAELDRQSAQLQAAISRFEEERRAALEQVAGMTVEQARQALLEMVEKEAREDMARLYRQIEAEARIQAEERAREIIATAIQRIASEQVAELTVSVVPLPNDEMKGRIIGRNGRNIRALEKITGVEIIVDDTPEAITLSSHDPVRREIARIALTRLIQDGRIHPARIEKVVAEAREEVERIIWEEGQQAAAAAGVTGLHPELIRLLGRLKFRTSYGQNQLHHAVEVAWLAGMIAAELGADVRIARMGGLLHDIGKAVDHQVEGTHALIGAELARRYGAPPKVVNCIASHHHEVPQECIEAVIVEAADAISGARPGARRETLEMYLKRIQDLENLARSYPGVAECYAIQAGREIRIIVKPEEVDDLAVIRMSREIARKIEETMQYPGQIKVTVIRETRAVEIAR